MKIFAFGMQIIIHGKTFHGRTTAHVTSYVKLIEWLIQQKFVGKYS